MPLGGQGVAQPLDVAALVLQGGLRQLDVHLSDIGVEDHEPVDPHGGGFGCPKQLGHRHDGVFVDPRLAGEPPPLVELAHLELLVIGGCDRRRTFDDLHLALATGATTAAGRVDRQADPMSRAEKRRPRWDPGRLAEGLVR